MQYIRCSISQGVPVHPSVTPFKAPKCTLTHQARSKNIDGNLSGDGLQNGGLLVVSKGGEEVLLNHREETPGDHVANDVILKALGISQPR